MARQRYYGEKFKPTKGAFGGTSKYNRRLKEEAKIKAAVEEKIRKDKEKEASKTKKKTNKKKVDATKEVKVGNDNDLKQDGN